MTGAITSTVEMENSQGRRPNEVAGFGNMNTNYSWPNELTQDIEIPVRALCECQNRSRRAACYRNSVNTADAY